MDYHYVREVRPYLTIQDNRCLTEIKLRHIINPYDNYRSDLPAATHLDSQEHLWTAT